VSLCVFRASIVNDAKTVGYINAIKDKIVLTGNIVKLSNTAKPGVKVGHYKHNTHVLLSIKRWQVVDLTGAITTFSSIVM
jgi:hypothetical protein